jgi:hypothetical protein
MEHKYLVSVGVPLLLLCVGTVSKKLVRGTGGWQASDAFLGIEASAAALTGALTYVLDVLKLLFEKIDAKADPGILRPIAANLRDTGIFLAFALLLFLFLLATHQQWEKAQEPADDGAWRRWKWDRKRFWLTGLSNLVGFGLLVSFLLLIKTLV